MGFELRGGSQLGPLVRASDSEWVLMYPAVYGTLSAETARLHCSAPRLQSCSNPPVPTAVAQEQRRSRVDCKPSVAGGSRRDAPAPAHTLKHTHRCHKLHFRVSCVSRSRQHCTSIPLTLRGRRFDFCRALDTARVAFRLSFCLRVHANAQDASCGQGAQ